MRIIKGIYKTRRYKFPKGFPSRPTTDMAKEGLFNVLDHHYHMSDIKILDLCAGTGNISIEFLSQECGEVIAVDSNFNCVRHMKNVVKDLGCEDKITIVKSDILKFLEKVDGKYDIIFADPPYEYDLHPEIVNLVFERDLLTDNGGLIIEHGRETKLEHLTHFQFVRTYGNVHFSFFDYTAEE